VIKSQALSWIVLAVLLAAPSKAQAQNSTQQAPTSWFKTFRTFSIYAENDALAKWAKDTTDETYTQGMRFTWGFSKFPDWAEHVSRFPLRVLRLATRLKSSDPIEEVCTPQVDRSLPCGSVSFGLGQTIYSPVNIRTSFVQPQDQPFAGWLFVTAAAHVRDQRLQSSTELVFGVTGPASIGRETQSWAHWTWSHGSARPGGWDNQLRGAVHGGVIQTWSGHLLEWCAQDNTCTGVAAENRVFDLTPRVEVVGTTTMLRSSVGGTARLGYRFPDRLGQRIPATGAPMTGVGGTGWIALSGSADRRFVGYNAFLTGGYRDGGPDGWRTIHKIEPRKTVDEFSIGLAGGTRLWTFSAQAVWRTPEWDPIIDSVTLVSNRPKHTFLSIEGSLNFEPVGSQQRSRPFLSKARGALATAWRTATRQRNNNGAKRKDGLSQ
jgi:lipid A 3-O-deacylase